MSESALMRFVNIKGSIYIRKEDIVEFIREIAGAEETDVRNRLNEAATNINKVG